MKHVLMSIIDKIIEQIIYFGSILPRIGVRRKFYEIDEKDKIVLTKGFNLKLSKQDLFFLSLCNGKKSNIAIRYNDYKQEDTFYSILENITFYGHSSGIIDKNGFAILDSVMDYSSYIHTRLSNPINLIIKKKKRVFIHLLTIILGQKIIIIIGFAKVFQDYIF